MNLFLFYIASATTPAATEISFYLQVIEKPLSSFVNRKAKQDIRRDKYTEGNFIAFSPAIIT